jgi:hypothetical protein
MLLQPAEENTQHFLVKRMGLGSVVNLFQKALWES